MVDRILYFTVIKLPYKFHATMLLVKYLKFTKFDSSLQKILCYFSEIGFDVIYLGVQ